MRYQYFIKIINLVLVLTLLFAPVEMLFANSLHGMPGMDDKVHTASQGQAADMQQAGNTDEQHDMLDSHCEKQCSHCAFCSVAVMSSYPMEDEKSFIFNPRLKHLPADVVITVDRRPPKSAKLS